jgi:type VI secretion system protein ImpH
MADESGPAQDPLRSAEPAGAGNSRQSLAQFLDALARAPHRFDFFQALRRIEALSFHRGDRPRLGAALRPADEPIRLGQEPDLAFAASALARLRPALDGAPPRLAVNFFGLFGPNGPLPLHLTEYARDRQRNADDPTMVRFFDLFHHRMLMLFYRAWASGQPTVSHDRPAANRFELYVGALAGYGLTAVRARDSFPDAAKLYYAGRLAAQSRNAEGLAAVIGDFFRVPAQVEQFVGGWIELPLDHRWKLGGSTARGGLGISTTIGAQIWAPQQKFRIVLGPLARDEFQRMLPGGSSLPRLAALVRGYTGDELRWDLRLVLEDRVEEPWHLGRSRLAWTAWLGHATGGRREDVVLDPQADAAHAAA